MAYATTITDVLNQWAEIGVFAYVLPFLMIFAVIYGILSKTQILGGRKGVDATIALADRFRFEAMRDIAKLRESRGK